MSQAVLKKRLKALMNKPENQVCSDCPERQPRWASLIVPPPGSPPGSLPMGAFCCLECSGSHRRLGVHISFVRSVNLDSWKEREVLAMENGGNKKVNAVFEARLGGGTKPHSGADGRTRERFIRDKYERRKFYDPSRLQQYEEEESEEEESEEEETRAAPRRVPAKPVRAPPSEAARRRVESRQARLSASGGTTARIPEKTKIKQPKAPAPANAPPPVDLLDFGADFSNAPAPAPVPATIPKAASAPATANQTMDLFANMTVSGVDTASSTGASADVPAEKPKEEEAPRTSNEQILAMFNTPVQQQQVGFGGMNGMMMQNNGRMMGGNMNNMNPSMMQQQQMMMMQQQNLMMQQPQKQQNNMMMQQSQMPPQQQNNMTIQANCFGNQNMMMQNQSNMPLQQQQQNNQGSPVMKKPQSMPMQHQGGMMMQPNGNVMYQEGLSFPQMPMGSGPPIGTMNSPGRQETTVTQEVASPSGSDPFASFGVNVFRSEGEI